MTTRKGDTQKSRAARKPAKPPSQQRQDDRAPGDNGTLTERQVLALWELIIRGDGRTAGQRAVELKPAEVKGLAREGLITVENGPRPRQPGWMSRLHLTDAAWAWANQQGLAVRMPTVKATALVLDELLAKIGKYLSFHDLGLHDLLRPRRSEPDPTPPHEPTDPATLEERIRAAYLRVTGGAMNQSVELARLRAQLGGEPVEAVDDELRRMQRTGSTVLYPIDDPQRLRPEDDAAAMRVAGERRDLVCIKR
jgi:hypothetical protein